MTECRRRSVVLIGLVSAIASCSDRTPTAPATPPPAVFYSVTGTAKTINVGYTTPIGSIFIDPQVPLPFTYTWTSAQSGAHLLLSAYIDTPGDLGSIRVSISKNGAEIGSDTATGYPNWATVSASY